MDGLKNISENENTAQTMHDDNTSENTKACIDISDIRNKFKKKKHEDAGMDKRVQFKF